MLTVHKVYYIILLHCNSSVSKGALPVFLQLKGAVFLQAADIFSSFHIPLCEILELDVFSGSRVLGGAAGLGRFVSGINLTDTPDYCGWIKENELLVTTCFALSSDPSALLTFIPTLARKGLAGVCIKPRRFIPALTPEMIRSADEHSLPLVELPDDVRFADVIKAVTDMLLERQTEVLKRMQSFNDMLIRMILEGADLDAVARGVGELTGTTVLIADSTNSRTALFVAPADEAGFSGMQKAAVCRTVSQGARPHPLEVEGHRFGYLYIYGAGDMGALHAEMLKQLSKTIPLEIARERSLRETADVHFRDFLLHLIGDKILDENRESMRAKRFGMDLAGTHMLLRLSPLASRLESAQQAALSRTLLYNEAQSALANKGIFCRTVRDEEELVVYLNAPPGSTALLELSAKIPALCAKLFQKYPGAQMLGGCGRAFSGALGLAKSSREAQTALRVAGNLKKSGVMGFDEIGLLRLVYADRPEAAIQSFLEETIGALLGMNRQRGSELLTTLESYFEHYGNLKKVSEHTFTHYNTVVYRLKSIRDITGLDLRVPEERFRLELALNLHRLLSGEREKEKTQEAE